MMNRIGMTSADRRNWCYRIIAPTLMVWAVHLALAGCSGHGDYDRGSDHLRDGQYDEAVSSLERAVEEEPYNPMYRRKLAEAQAEAADEHAARADALMAEHRLSEAWVEMQAALDVVPAYPEGLEKLDKIDAGIERSGKLAQEAQWALDRNDHSKAMQLLAEAETIDVSHPSVVALRKELKSDASPPPAARPSPPEEAWTTPSPEGRPTVATRPAKVAARNNNVAEPEAKPKVDSPAEIRERQAELEELVGQVDGHLASGRVAQAIDLLDQAVALSPDDTALRRRRDTYVTEYARQELDRYERRAMAGRWEDAWRHAMAALTLKPDDLRAIRCSDKADSIVRRRLASDIPEAAERPPSPSSSVASDVCWLFREVSEAPMPEVNRRLGRVFADILVGQRLEACRRLVLAQLSTKPLRKVTPPTRPATVAKTRPAIAQSTPPAATSAPAPASRPSVPNRRVFEGTVSRDDDRYPKELMTVDGIVFRVKDTDPDPVDVDLEIRVGEDETTLKNKPVGTRIRGRGLSRQRYDIVIVHIHDDTETVRFAIERVDGPD